MDVFEVIRSRRTIKAFSPREVTRAEIERLLEAAVLAPNHRMTEPWRFLVLGEAARRAYGSALGRRKARKVEDPAAAEAVKAKAMAQVMGVPAVLAVTQRLAEDPEIREEDYAACMMALQNVLLEAVVLGLGTAIKTGAVMNDPEVREGWGVPEGERVVAVVYLGEPAEVPAPKPRTPAAERTEWLR